MSTIEQTRYSAALATPGPLSAPEGYRHVELDIDADREEIIELDSWAFAFELPDDGRPPFPLEAGRTAGLRDADGELIAMRGSYAFTMPVPGGSLPTAGLTWVGVHPGHRRRGLATALLTAHLRRTRERGEPLSALFAAEMAIYGRFGYGLAARQAGMTLPRGAALRDVAGSQDVRIELRRFDPEVHTEIVAELHSESTRPGWVSPTSRALRDSRVSDVPAWRDGFEKLRIAIARDAGGRPRGYALFRRKENWDSAGRPDGAVRVRELVAHDAATVHALWSTLLDLDLMGSVTTPPLALDDVLFHLLVDARAGSPALRDNVWVRLVDVPSALTGRRYSAPLDVVLDVADRLLPENAGRWRLRVDSGGAPQVEATSAPADLSLDVADLGAAFLGGTSLAALAAAGAITSRSEELLRRASTAFGWSQAPLCSWVF